MNPKNALIMLAAILLIVINLFEGDTTISNVASGDPESIAQSIEEGGELIEQAALGSAPTGSRQMRSADPITSFDEDEPSELEQEPGNEEFQDPTDVEPEGNPHSQLSPDIVDSEPFDPRIR